MPKQLVNNVCKSLTCSPQAVRLHAKSTWLVSWKQRLPWIWMITQNAQCSARMIREIRWFLFWWCRPILQVKNMQHMEYMLHWATRVFLAVVSVLWMEWISAYKWCLPRLCPSQLTPTAFAHAYGISSSVNILQLFLLLQRPVTLTVTWLKHFPSQAGSVCQVWSWLAQPFRHL